MQSDTMGYTTNKFAELRCLYVFMIFPSGHRILPATLIMPTWSCSVDSCPDFGEHRILRCVFNAAPIIILSNS